MEKMEKKYYSNGHSGLDISVTVVSVCENYTDHHVLSITLLSKWLLGVKTYHKGFGDKSLAAKQESLTNGKTELYEKYKSQLPCVAMGGRFKYINSDKKNLIEDNHLYVIDIDNLDPSDVSIVKKEIFDLPFVYAVGESLSGKGVWGVVPLDPDKNRTKLINGIEEYFWVNHGLELDEKCRNIDRLRVYSHDPEILVKGDDEIVYDWAYESNISRDTMQTSIDIHNAKLNSILGFDDGIDHLRIDKPIFNGFSGYNEDLNNDLNDDNFISYLIKYLVLEKGYKVIGRNEWLSMLGALSPLDDKLGVELAQLISVHSPNYKNERDVSINYIDMKKRTVNKERTKLLKFYKIAKDCMPNGWKRIIREYMNEDLNKDLNKDKR